MGRSNEAAMAQQELEWNIDAARAEGAYYAVPDTLSESLEINKHLKDRLTILTAAFDASRSPRVLYRERIVGFAFGIGASLTAAVIWWVLAKYLPMLSAV